MAHTYAHVGEFKGYVTDSGATAYGTQSDALILAYLESASRRLDGFCGRSRFGSGFGPRTASNRYDSNGDARLDLDDDLLTITSVTVLAGTGGASSTLTEDTDYYAEPYGRDQKRHLLLHGLTNVTFSAGWRTVTVAGTAGYSNTRRTATATLGAAISSTTATTFTIGGTDDLALGMTLRIDSEDLYLRARSGTTATVDRGANGTTAATHLNGAAIVYYVYPEGVTPGTLQVAHRRWRARDAGLTGDYGGGDMPIVGPRDSERSILAASVGHLRLFAAAG